MRKPFSEEYKVEAVSLVLEQGLIPAQAARDLGIGQTTLEKWVRTKKRDSSTSRTERN